MSKIIVDEVGCSICNGKQEAKIYASVNVTVDPSLKEAVLQGKINWVQCKNCGTSNFIPIEFVYHDMDKRFMVIFKHPYSTDTGTERGFADYADRFGSIAEYMSFPVIVNDPYELIFAVLYCDKKRTPKSKEDALEISLLIKKMRKMADIPTLKNAPEQNLVDDSPAEEEDKRTKIQLSEELRHWFGREAFATHGLHGTVTIMTSDHFEKIKVKWAHTQENDDQGFLRFLMAGISDCDITASGTLYLPEYLNEFLLKKSGEDIKVCEISDQLLVLSRDAEVLREVYRNLKKVERQIPSIADGGGTKED